MTEIDLAWESLAKAIVHNAVIDWRDGDEKERVAIRRFFQSDWCKALIDIDPLVILERLEKEEGGDK